MKYLLPLCLLMVSTFVKLSAQDKIEIEVLDDKNKSSKFELNWPFDGPPPIGADLDAALDSLDREISEVCPPKRRKLSDNIWKCGNGKRIRTNNRKLNRVLRIIAEKREED